MAEHLFLSIGSAGLEWLSLDEGSGIVRFRGEGDWNDVAAMAGEMDWSGRTHVIVPGETVLLTRASVPSKQMRQVLQAVPFMVEESLACDVEDCHFAVGGRGDGGAVRVAVIDRETMQDWFGRLRDSGIVPSTMTADVEHLGRDRTGTSVLIDGERALICCGDNAFATELDSLPMAIGLLGEAAGDVSVLAPPEQTDAIEMFTSQIAADERVVTTDEIDYGVFELICRQFDEGAINLLQGAFKVDERRRERRNPWPAVAGLAAAAFALHIMLLIVQGIYLDVKAAQFEQEARALYADVFPNDRNVRDLRRRWQSRIRAGTGEGGDDFVALLGEAARQIPARMRLENINFNETRGDMSLQLVAGQSSEFVRYAQSLTAAGLVAEVGTINQIDDGARGNIKIRTTP